MKKIIQLSYIFIVFVLFNSCTKYTDGNTAINNNTPVIAPIIPPTIKFYNVMDFGGLNVLLNGKQVSSVANFYPSNYVAATQGNNSIQLTLPNKTQLLSNTVSLLNNTKYSCFFYKVGNEWKFSLIKDDMSKVLNTGFAAARILDFRTQSYFDYINVRMVNPGFEIIDSKKRNFLDHVTYNSYSDFKEVGAGNYNIFMYNDTLTTSQRKNVKLDSKGFYSIVLTTPSNITPYSDAIFYIFPDAIKH